MQSDLTISFKPRYQFRLKLLTRLICLYTIVLNMQNRVISVIYVSNRGKILDEQIIIQHTIVNSNLMSAKQRII